MPTFTMVGASFRPAEAKEIIKQLSIGDTVDLVADPENQHDSSAVKVEYDGIHLGFIPAAENSAPFNFLLSGDDLPGTVIAFESTLKPIIEYEMVPSFESYHSEYE